jgi:hypothetical protein
MIKFLSVLFFVVSGALYAQTGGAYIIPRQIFVGDPAALVLPLAASSQNNSDIILTGDFPADENIDFHRIILEQRVTGSRLIIEFTAFAAGTIELPEIEIGGEKFYGLSVTVNSVISSRSDLALSTAASSLAMPGTAFMLYGSMAALVCLLLIVIWFIVKGQTVMRILHNKWKRYRLFAGIRKTEKRLYKAVIKGADKREILDKLSGETRNFLSVLTGSNCRSMTAREFEILPVQLNIQEDNVSFGDFFKSCDEFRFSGVSIDSRDIIKLLDDLKRFTNILEEKAA